MSERTPRPVRKGNVLDLSGHFARKQAGATQREEERALERKKELKVAMDIFDLHARTLLATLAKEGASSARASRIRSLLDKHVADVERLSLTDAERQWCQWDSRLMLLNERIAEYGTPDQRSQHAS